MNLAELETKLLAAARNNPPSDHVPYAFEQRVMSRIRERPAADPAAYWAQALWRGALSCVAVVVLLGAFSWFSPATSDLDDHLDEALLAAVPHDSEF